MSDREIKTAVDRLLEQLHAELRQERDAARRFEELADSYWKQVQELTRERDRLQTELNNLHALRCSNPACQLCQVN